MNLSKLFPIQKKLDERIVKEKGLEGQDLLDKKILALQVELGELANEWQMFKFWKDNPRPNEKSLDLFKLEWTNPLLEEYVDCLHFILSIGNDLGFSEERLRLTADIEPDGLTELFIEIMSHVNDLFWELFHNGTDDYDMLLGKFRFIVVHFRTLGSMLGFTWEQIEKAYLHKNKVNHERQENEY